MRIISGQFKSRRLKMVSEHTTRSTKDRVKETLFNMLGPFHFERCLDLFAGSGSLGLEALSRGAKHATFVELKRDAFNILRENVATLKVNDRANMHRGEALETLERMQETFDLIFLDPPYESPLLDESLSLIALHEHLEEDGLIVTLSAKNQRFEIPEAFTVYKQRTVGVTDVTFLKWSD